MKTRRGSLPVGAALFLVLLAPATLRAQEARPADSLCTGVLVAQGRPAGPAARRPCQSLALMIVTRRTEGLFAALKDKELPPRDLQSTTLAPSAAGSPAQGDAVPESNPVSLAAGTLSMVGSNAGTNAITTIGINPALFAVDPNDREEVARLSRLMDLSVLVPVSGVDKDRDGKVDYFGLRLRLSMTGLASGSALMRTATDSFRTIVETDAALTLQLRDRLEAMRDPVSCANALLADQADAAAMEKGCDGRVDFTTSPERHEHLAAVLMRAREEADSKYFGLDLRLDIGDPTLGAVAGASGTALFGGLAAGRRYNFSKDGLTTGGLKARLGVRFNQLDLDSSATSFSADGGIGFEMQRPYENQRLSVSTGAEFRVGKGGVYQAQAQTNFLLLRASLAVPMFAGNSVTLNFAAPVAGKSVSPVLTVGMNWGLLLPKPGP